MSGKAAGTAPGFRISALVETAALVAALLIADTVFGAGNRFAGLSPSPFWIPVLLASAYYGINEGLIAAAVCSVVALAGNMPEQHLNEDLSAWLLRSTSPAVLWFLAAVVLGEIRSAQRRAHVQVETQLADTRLEAETIAAAYQTMQQLNAHLEERVAAQVQTVRTVYLASRAIERTTKSEVWTGIRPFVLSMLNPGKFSVFLVNGSTLEATQIEGWNPEDPFNRKFASNSFLFQAIVRERQMLSVTDPVHERILRGEGILAGPIVSPETGRVIGMLKIERLDFVDFTPTTVHNFRVVCDWIGNAIAAAEKMEQLEANRHLDRLPGVMPASFFVRQRTVPETLARRTGFNLSVAFIGVELPAHAEPEGRTGAECRFSAVAEEALPPTDLLFDYRHGGWDYVILMPGRAIQDADHAVQKLLSMLSGGLNASGVQARFRHSVQSIHNILALAD
jgi:polysaccharide biosynthesis protein PelD